MFLLSEFIFTMSIYAIYTVSGNAATAHFGPPYVCLHLCVWGEEHEFECLIKSRIHIHCLDHQCVWGPGFTTYLILLVSLRHTEINQNPPLPHPRNEATAPDRDSKLRQMVDERTPPHPRWLDMKAVIGWLCFPSTGIIGHFTSRCHYRLC